MIPCLGARLFGAPFDIKKRPRSTPRPEKWQGKRTARKRVRSADFSEYGQEQSVLPRKQRKKTPLLHKAAVPAAKFHKTGDLRFVFLAIQGAGHVKQRAAGTKMLPGMAENVGLRAHGFGKTLRRKAQAKLGVSGYRSRAAAWNIQ